MLHLPDLFDEIQKNENKGLAGCQDRLLLSAQAHLGRLHNLLSPCSKVSTEVFHMTCLVYMLTVGCEICESLWLV